MQVVYVTLSYLLYIPQYSLKAQPQGLRAHQVPSNIRISICPYFPHQPNKVVLFNYSHCANEEIQVLRDKMVALSYYHTDGSDSGVYAAGFANNSLDTLASCLCSKPSIIISHMPTSCWYQALLYACWVCFKSVSPFSLSLF